MLWRMYKPNTFYIQVRNGIWFIHSVLDALTHGRFSVAIITIVSINSARKYLKDTNYHFGLYCVVGK